MKELLSKASSSIWNNQVSMRPCSGVFGPSFQESLKGEKIQNSQVLVRCFVHKCIVCCNFSIIILCMWCPPTPPVPFAHLWCSPLGLLHTKVAWMFLAWVVVEVGSVLSWGCWWTCVLWGKDLWLRDGCVVEWLEQLGNGPHAMVRGNPLLVFQSGILQQRDLDTFEEKAFLKINGKLWFSWKIT